MGRRRTGEMPRVVVVKPHGHAGVRIGGKAYWLGKCPDGKPTPAPDGGADLYGRLGNRTGLVCQKSSNGLKNWSRCWSRHLGAGQSTSRKNIAFLGLNECCWISSVDKRTRPQLRCYETSAGKYCGRGFVTPLSFYHARRQPH